VRSAATGMPVTLTPAETSTTTNTIKGALA
jgi:hypothetical protein